MSTFNETIFSLATGCRLNYAVGPSHGPPLVLLHGVLRCWRDYAPLLAELSLRYHVFALDFRGHGESTNDPQANYRVVDYVEDALTMVREIVPKPAFLYGHSLGAMVAAAVAAHQGNQIAGLILEDPPLQSMGSRIYETSLGSYFQALERVVINSRNLSVMKIAQELAEIPLEDQPGVKLGDVRDAVSLRFSAACMRRVDPRVFQPILEAKWLEGYDIESIHRKISAPTLSMQADPNSGGMLTDQDAAKMVREIDDCTMVRFPETGHLIHWTQRDRTLQHLFGFLESIA